MSRIANFAACMLTALLAALLVLGTLALLCHIFAPQLDAFDRGESPCCNAACFGVLLVGTLAAINWRRS